MTDDTAKNPSVRSYLRSAEYRVVSPDGFVVSGTHLPHHTLVQMSFWKYELEPASYNSTKPYNSGERYIWSGGEVLDVGVQIGPDVAYQLGHALLEFVNSLDPTIKQRYDIPLHDNAAPQDKPSE